MPHTTAAEDADGVPKPYTQYFRAHALVAFGIDEVPTRSQFEFLQSDKMRRHKLGRNARLQGFADEISWSMGGSQSLQLHSRFSIGKFLNPKPHICVFLPDSDSRNSKPSKPPKTDLFCSDRMKWRRPSLTFQPLRIPTERFYSAVSVLRT